MVTRWPCASIPSDMTQSDWETLEKAVGRWGAEEVLRGAGLWLCGEQVIGRE